MNDALIDVLCESGHENYCFAAMVDRSNGECLIVMDNEWWHESLSSAQYSAHH
jgi:hypothetical protein